MFCKGEFIFKSIKEVSGGEFTNDKGDLIKYGASYCVKFDEVTDNGIFERRLKFPIDNKDLFDRFKALNPYTVIILDLSVSFSSSNTFKVVPLGFTLKK